MTCKRTAESKLLSPTGHAPFFFHGLRKQHHTMNWSLLEENLLKLEESRWEKEANLLALNMT